MPKKPDSNESAIGAIERLIGEPLVENKTAESPKNPAAVALGRLGGKKGGPARAAKLTKAQRKAIASKAAKARWKKKPAKSAKPITVKEAKQLGLEIISQEEIDRRLLEGEKRIRT